MDKTEWLVDSGASSHMTSVRDKFVSMKELRTPVRITIADGTKIDAVAKGIVALKLMDWTSVKLSDVLYIPEVERMVGMMRFVKSGYTGTDSLAGQDLIACGHFSGIYKGVQAISAAAAWHIGAVKIDPLDQLFVNWLLCNVAMVGAYASVMQVKKRRRLDRF
ncbi:unnamed protein product [Phytophthora lilii]|uniref:Unnamed protein product n=1 Tax=Phytophthora lilii TaxID=2077276 RepID=A0A9W6U585_9STRA|nr:unnamed protein product [Phytophthora lilii]